MQAEDAPQVLQEACSKYGFFYLANHGIDQTLVDQVRRDQSRCRHGRREGPLA